MQLLALTEGPDHVCCRYRIEAYRAALAVRGWTLQVLPLDRSTFRRTRQLRAAATADAVILQRKLLPLWQLRRLRKTARTLIYDFDDALFCRDSYSEKGPASWKRLAHFWATIHAADAVFAGNRFLLEQAAAYVEPEKVHLLPTCVDPRLYEPAAHDRPAGALRLVWIGQRSTLPCLDRAQQMLTAAAARVPNLELRIVCDTFPQFPGVRVESCRWSTATEAASLADADVGISWLPDDQWSRGKCNLKVFQYMAAGLPIVANPVGMHEPTIRNGVNGFVSSTPDGWADCIERLAGDPSLRRRLGANGRHYVARHFSVQRWADAFADLVVETHGRSADRGAAPVASC